MNAPRSTTGENPGCRSHLGRGGVWMGVLTAIVWCGNFPGSTVDAAPFVPKRDAHCVAISPDGRLVAIGFSGPSNSEFPPRPHPNPRKSAVVLLFDAVSRQRLRRMETFGDLTRIAFSADGTLLAASRLFTMDGNLELNEVRIWDVATGQTRFTLDRCHAFSFAPGRTEIAVASRKRCVTYDLATGEKRSQLDPLADALTLTHSADGSSVLGIVATESGFCLRSCSLENAGMEAESSPFKDPCYSIAIAGGGGGMATGHAAGMVLVRDPATLQPRARFQTGGAGRAYPFFSPNGDLLAAADQSNSDVIIWEFATGREIARYTFQQGSVLTLGAKSASRVIKPELDPARFVFSPDGEAFLGGPYGGILRLVTNGRDIARFGE